MELYTAGSDGLILAWTPPRFNVLPSCDSFAPPPPPPRRGAGAGGGFSALGAFGGAGSFGDFDATAWAESQSTGARLQQARASNAAAAGLADNADAWSDGE
jgi:hypothetical protein